MLNNFSHWCWVDKYWPRCLAVGPLCPDQPFPTPGVNLIIQRWKLMTVLLSQSLFLFLECLCFLVRPGSFLYLAVNLWLQLVVKHWEFSSDYRFWLTGLCQVIDDRKGGLVLVLQFTLVSCLGDSMTFLLEYAYLCHQIMRLCRTQV